MITVYKKFTYAHFRKLLGHPCIETDGWTYFIDNFNRINTENLSYDVRFKQTAFELVDYEYYRKEFPWNENVQSNPKH